MNHSPNNKRRVVITGMGLVSCLGLSLDEVSESLQKGKSGIMVSEEREQKGFLSPLTAKLPHIDPSEYLSKKQRKTMGEPSLYASLAARHAFAESGTDPEIFRNEQTGIILGNDSTAGAIAETITHTLEEGTTAHLGSGAVVRTMNSSPTINLGTYYGIKGGSMTISAACSSGAHAVGFSSMLIKSGQVDRMMTGGCQEICWESMASFDGLTAFSQRKDDPATASRPFDKNRDGLVPGGGAAILFLEELEAAKARGATVYAEILAYAFNSDGHHITEPDSSGPARCIQLALNQQGLNPSDIDYINAHATSTQVGDRNEAKAIYEVFGNETPPISSTKSMTGHECWMAGASEIAYCCLMIRDGFIAPNMNFTEFDDETPALNIAKTTLDQRPRIVLSNSFGFGGTNACIILQKTEDL